MLNKSTSQELCRELFSLRKKLADLLGCQKQHKYDLSENLKGYDFPIVNLLGHASDRKIQIHSSTDAESFRLTTIHRTDIYRLTIRALWKSKTVTQLQPSVTQYLPGNQFL